MPAQLAPFNEHQFDRCALWLANKLGKVPTQYDLIKFHIMTDVYHVLDYGAPIIGGAVAKWKWGPAVDKAYARISPHRIKSGDVVGSLRVQDCHPTGRGTVVCEFVPAAGAVIDEEGFSDSEIDAMKKALKVVNLNFDQSQEFFHNPRSFMGKAWADAHERGPIDWNSIIDAYDAEHKADHSAIKELIALGV